MRYYEFEHINPSDPYIIHHIHTKRSQKDLVDLKRGAKKKEKWPGSGASRPKSDTPLTQIRRPPGAPPGRARRWHRRSRREVAERSSSDVPVEEGAPVEEGRAGGGGACRWRRGAPVEEGRAGMARVGDREGSGGGLRGGLRFEFGIGVIHSWEDYGVIIMF
jgi:hypothetical protein